MIHLSISTALILFLNFEWSYSDYPDSWPCLLPKDSGESCEGGIYKYYWNDEAKKCSLFYYGGCDGNENSFFTKEECMYYCKWHGKIRQNENDDYDDDNDDDQVNGKMTALEYLRKLIQMGPSKSIMLEYETRNFLKFLKKFQSQIDL